MQNGGFPDPMGYNAQSTPAPMPILQPQGAPQTFYPAAPQQLYQPPEVAPAALPPQRLRQEPPKPKGPIPEEHLPLQTVFDQLRNTCAASANNPVRNILPYVSFSQYRYFRFLWSQSGTIFGIG